MAEAVFGFEEADLLHVLFVRDRVEEVEPVGDGFAVLLFDGWEVGGGAGGFVLRLHLLVVPRPGGKRHSGGRSSEEGFRGATLGGARKPFSEGDWPRAPALVCQNQASEYSSGRRPYSAPDCGGA